MTLYCAPRNHVGHYTFPEGCKYARVDNCAAYSGMYKDPRGYTLIKAGGLYHAGCRHFTRDQALAHWGSGYAGDGDGAAYVNAILKDGE